MFEPRPGWSRLAGLIDVNFRRGGLTDGRRISRFLRSFGLDRPIEDYAMPYTAIATDLESGREVWLQTGPIEPAVRVYADTISVPSADNWRCNRYTAQR